MLQLQEKATTTSYTKGQLMVGHQNNNQVLIKNALALIPGEVFQSNFRHGNSNGTFILSKDELSKKGIDLSNGLDFIGEAVLTF